MSKDSDIVLAIKMILIGKDQDSIKKEIEILKKCNHDNIVRYYGSATKENYFWIMMDFCGAGSVTDIMKKGKIVLNEREIAYIIHSSLKGLAYLHKMAIIHRDIKSGNILLTDDGRVKLADFGVSSQLNEKLTRTKTFIGTALWMSPEVLNQEPYDYKADIWAIGITAIEMADGVPPHFEKHQMRAMFLIPSLPPPTVKQPDNFTAPFNEFIAKILVKDPAMRPNAETILKEPFLTDAPNWSEDLKKRIQTVLRPQEATPDTTPRQSPNTSPSNSYNPIKDGQMPPNAEPKNEKIEKEKSDKSDINNADKKNNNTQVQSEYVKKILEDYKHESESQKLKIKELEDEIKELKDANKTLKKKLKQTEEDLEYAEDDIEELKEKLGKYERKKEKRRSSVTEQPTEV